jgi:site-specific DNA recombinase
VSTERQADRGTIGSQLQLLRERIAAAGDEPVGEYLDDGQSGARLDRPGLDALRDAAEAGLIERVWCLSPDRLARAYAYQVLVLDELDRFGVTVAFTDSPGLAADDPQSVLLTQVQGVIAEYEKAKIAERYRRGKLFRARAGEIVTWKASYGYRRIARSPATGQAHHEVYEPEAAVVRRIFTDRAAGITVREICRRLNADAVPSPTGKPTWGHSTLSRLLRNEAYIGRVYYNRTESVPDRRPTRRTRQVPRDRDEWVPIDCPRIIADELFQAAGRVATDNTKWSPRRAEPGAWLLKGLVKCGVCGVGTNCHKMRGRNGTWHRYYYCRNHDPLRAGGESRRCPERNIRADALDAFVFDHIRAAITHPDQLLAGEQAVTLHTPIPDDELLSAELARLDRKIDAAEAERRRLIDLYQGGFIELPEMQRRATEVSARRKELQHKRTSLAHERTALAHDNQLRRRVHNFAARIHAVIDTLDDIQKQQLLRLLVEDVRVTGWHVQIRLRIALDPPPPQPPQPTGPPGPTGPTGPTGKPSLHPRPVSTQDGLRSLGRDLVAGVDQAVQQRFSDDGVGEQWIPVFGGPVAGEDQWLGGDGAVGDQVVEVVALGGGVLAHREVVDNEDQGAGVFAHALADGAIGVSAGEVGEHPGAFDEPDVAAASGYLVSKCLCHMGFPDPDGPVENHRLAGFEPAQRGQVAQHRGGQFRADGEVEVLEGGVLFEAGAAYSPRQRGGVAAGDLVFAEHLQEFQVAELPVAGLGEAGIEGVEHAGQFEGLERGPQAGIVNSHDRVLCLMWLQQRWIGVRG